MENCNFKVLSSLNSIRQMFPLSQEQNQFVLQERKKIARILTGEDPRLLIILGPCSAWPEQAVLDYAARLALLKPKLTHSIKLVMRVYIQKPRTLLGWMGPACQPNPFEPPDFEAGARYCRSMMLKVLDAGLPIATELLFTHYAKPFLDLISWAAIGARSSEDPEHRLFASGLPCPVGLKNPTHGNMAIAANSVKAAQVSHVAVFDGQQLETSGNLYAHLVLRGSYYSPNFSTSDLDCAKSQLDMAFIKNPGILIDASHDNCKIKGKKDYRLQYEVIMKVMEGLKGRCDLLPYFKGFMLESFIKAGSQELSPHLARLDLGGLSVTDPCIDFEETKKILFYLAEAHANQMRQKRESCFMLQP